MKEYKNIPTTMKKDGGSSPFIFTDFMALSISHSVKRSQKPMNMSTTNNNESRNSLLPLPGRDPPPLLHKL
jgi:hypothetical protein